MKIRMAFLLFVALPLVTVGVTQAQTGGGWDWLSLSYAERAYPGPETAVLMVLPDGSGAALTNAAIVGSTVDASITLYLKDWIYPVVDYPREDMWLESADGGLAMCAGGTIADANTNANGEAFWDQPLRAGGASEALTFVMVGGLTLQSSTGLAISFNSPDINGDGTVNLTDVPLFAGDFYGGPYAFRSDFHFDGGVNLSDLVHMAQGLGSSCP
jgi:hypothetical protein